MSDAVHALADPIPVWDGGTCRWSDPLYTRLRSTLTDAIAMGRRRVAAGSRAPCRGDVLALLIEVDTAVGVWEPDGKGTIDRLHLLTGRGWRPQDTRLIDDYCGQIERWVLAGTELLDAVPRVFLQQPCPRCAARFARRTDGAGEVVNTRALKVSETGCKCLGCGAFWGPERFEWLARLLGCEPLPA